MADDKKKGLPADTDIDESGSDLGQVVLTLENDEEITCDVIATFPCSNGNSYIALLPVDDEDSNYFLYRYTVDADGELVLEDIEEDSEFDLASEAFDELLDEMEYDEMFDDEEEGDE